MYSLVNLLARLWNANPGTDVGKFIDPLINKEAICLESRETQREEPTLIW